MLPEKRLPPMLLASCAKAALVAAAVGADTKSSSSYRLTNWGRGDGLSNRSSRVSSDRGGSGSSSGSGSGSMARDQGSSSCGSSTSTTDPSSWTIWVSSSTSSSIGSGADGGGANAETGAGTE